MPASLVAKTKPRLLRAAAAAGLGCAIALLSPSVSSDTPPPGVPAPPSPGAPTPAGSSSSGPSSERDPELEAALRKIVTLRALEHAAVGIAVIDVDSGRLLGAVNEHIALNPASNAKLYTAGAALATLHGEHRYETTLSGKIEGDAVVGPLAIRGYGDPSLTTADVGAMVDELKSYGVRRVDGDIFVDQRFYDDQTTPPAFDQQPNEWSSFRAPVSALAIDENCITLSIRPASRGSPARVQFEPPGFVDVEGTVTTGEDRVADTVELALSGVGSRMAARLSGAVAADSRIVRYTRRVEDPRLLGGYALKALLEKAEIKVTGEVKIGAARGRIVGRHQSEPLSVLLYALGKQSDNFYAEMIFKTLAAEGKGQPAKSADAAQVVTEWLSQIGALDAGVVVKNGSGLFDANRVTAWSTVELLRWAWRDPTVQADYLSQLAVGGVDGTLRKRFRGAKTKRRVRAKTGTLDDAIALSGYFLRDGGKGPLAFSILFNHVAGKQDVARRAADRFVETLAKR